jgi:hypothetical protein
MRTHDQTNETTLQTSYRSSASDLIIGGGALLGLILYVGWPLLKSMIGS